MKKTSLSLLLLATLAACGGVAETATYQDFVTPGITDVVPPAVLDRTIPALTLQEAEAECIEGFKTRYKLVERCEWDGAVLDTREAWKARQVTRS